MIAPKPPGISNTREGKAAILARTKKLVDISSMIIVAPVEGVTMEQMDLLRKEMPKGTKVSVVKNSLLRLAVKDTPFESLGEGLRDENVFFFVPEGASKATYEGFKKWQKDAKRAEPQFEAKAAAIEGTKYVGENVEAVATLPSKKELIAKLAVTIKGVPVKLVTTIKAVPTKAVLAIAALKAKKEEEAKASA